MMSNQYVREVQLNRDAVPSFKEYPFSLPAIRHLHSLERIPPSPTSSARTVRENRRC